MQRDAAHTDALPALQPPALHLQPQPASSKQHCLIPRAQLLRKSLQACQAHGVGGVVAPSTRHHPPQPAPVKLASLVQEATSSGTLPSKPLPARPRCSYCLARCQSAERSEARSQCYDPRPSRLASVLMGRRPAAGGILPQAAWLHCWDVCEACGTPSVSLPLCVGCCAGEGLHATRLRWIRQPLGPSRRATLDMRLGRAGRELRRPIPEGGMYPCSQ